MTTSIPACSAGLATFEGRLGYIKTLISNELYREVISASTLGRDSNNFVHLVRLVESSGSPGAAYNRPLDPGCDHLDRTTVEVVVRLSNPEAMLDEDVRVENEVAALTLMRRALHRLSRQIVPKVYAWQGSKTGFGWIVQEHVKGEQLSQNLSVLTIDQKSFVFDQLAEIFKMIQGLTLGFPGFGGLRFDDGGEVVAGRSSLWSIGPFATYADLYQGIFVRQLGLADESSFLNGWRGTGLRERLYHFNASGGFAYLLRHFSNVRPTLVHGDLSTENVLVDPDTLQITGLVDLDFCHVASPADEFFFSFADLGGLMPGPFEDEDLQRLRSYQCNGFPDIPSSAESGCSSVDWQSARLWKASLDKQEIARPAYFQHITELADIYWFLLDVCPPYFNMSRWMGKRTEEQQNAAKKATLDKLDKYLCKWGY